MYFQVHNTLPVLRHDLICTTPSSKHTCCKLYSSFDQVHYSFYVLPPMKRNIPLPECMSRFANIIVHCCTENDDNDDDYAIYRNKTGSTRLAVAYVTFLNTVLFLGIILSHRECSVSRKESHYLVLNFFFLFCCYV